MGDFLLFVANNYECPVVPLYESVVPDNLNLEHKNAVEQMLKSRSLLVDYNKLHLIWAMNKLEMPDDIIYLITKYAYDSIANQLKKIFINNKCDDKTLLDHALSMYRSDLLNSRLLTKGTNVSPSLLVFLCLYVNEYANIELSELDLKGTLVSLGQNCVRPRQKGDCCVYASVTSKQNIKTINDAKLSVLTHCKKLIRYTRESVADPTMDFSLCIQSVIGLLETYLFNGTYTDLNALSYTMYNLTHVMDEYKTEEEFEAAISLYKSETVDVEKRKRNIKQYIRAIILTTIIIHGA